MSVALECENLSKRYPGQAAFALGGESHGVSFEVGEGEMFALLGPSGCGKTTTLRIVGGFVGPSGGRVLIEGRDVTRWAPYRRPTNTVFQSYALFPHMSVGKNVEFGLAMERVGRSERRRRVAEALELVGLAGHERRRVPELSGGQAQRAALARALVKRPSVLLLDEPLGALDLRLRKQMQEELARLKGTTKTAFVHVTHDQEEACAIADRIAVMRHGAIVQIDTPLALYRTPRTAYVADFIDAGTLVRGSVTRSGADVEVEHPAVVVRGRSTISANHARLAAVIPRDRVTITSVDTPPPLQRETTVTGRLERLAFTGSVFDVGIRISDDLEIAAAVRAEEMDTFGSAFAVGATVKANWSERDVVFVEDDS